METDKALFVDNPDEYMTVREAAAQLKKVERTVYSMILSGRVSSVRVGGTTYVSMPDVVALPPTAMVGLTRRIERHKYPQAGAEIGG